MRNILLAGIALIGFASAASAQIAMIPPGQSDRTIGLSQTSYLANTASRGFQEASMATGVVGAGTTQATSTLLLARNNVVSCAAGAGVQLPAVQRFVPIVVLNRGAAACLVYPTLGGFAESAPGTLAAVNVGVSVAAGATVTFKPAIVGAATDWLQ